MATCSGCRREIPADSWVCPYCAAAVVRAGEAEASPLTETVVSPPRAGRRGATDGSQVSGSSDSLDGQFAPGTLLGGRYRIVALIGRGGMGEVYRADDLRLRHPIALKFLPQVFANDARRLERLHQEVRIARLVSHPNVCRVYDITEADGFVFLSMEYVDGVDLASLMRRMGKFSHEKALQVARQICAGLAAAHDKGVLHRDLKPHNVMLDEDGKVRITDFGLAATAKDLVATDVRAGTPAYMAPEQAEGREVSVRSDVYSLGLVLFELFTGRRALVGSTAAELDASRKALSSSATTDGLDQLDPVIERVITRCLSLDPKLRPGSALAVAAALPGGDPLAAALAAGETPSPELVANAGEVGGLKVSTAVVLLACIVLALGANVWHRHNAGLLRHLALEKPPAVLLDRARQILTRLGHPPPKDEAFRFRFWDTYLRHIERTDRSPDRWKRLALARPAVMDFMYRASQSPMSPRGGEWQVDVHDPPFVESGMTRISLDTKGRLIRYVAFPPAKLEAYDVLNEPDWSVFFREAELAMSDFSPSTPKWTVTVPSDVRLAWAGRHKEAPDVSVQIEAGALGGQATHFVVVETWDQQSGGPVDARQRVQMIAFFVVLGVIIPASVWMSIRHARAGRGDRRGAYRLLLYVYFIFFGAYQFQAHHVASIEEMRTQYLIFGMSAAAALQCCVLYLALEPYARKLWPHSLISWSRLVGGRLRDPLVGRDLLIGCTAGAALASIDVVTGLIERTGSGPPPMPQFSGSIDVLRGTWFVIGQLFESQDEIGVFIGLPVLLLVLRFVLRRDLPALCVFCLIISAATTNFFQAGLGPCLVKLAGIAILVFGMVRYGLLAIIAAATFMSLQWQFPCSLDLSSWYGPSTLVGPVAALCLALYGFWTALAGRALFRDELG